MSPYPLSFRSPYKPEPIFHPPIYSVLSSHRIAQIHTSNHFYDNRKTSAKWGNSIRGVSFSRENSNGTGRFLSDSPSPEPSSPNSPSVLPVSIHPLIFFNIWFDRKFVIKVKIDYVFLCLFYCRRRSEKLRICSEAQEVRNYTI